MALDKITSNEIAAWFLNKATMPPSEATQLLVRHLECDNSLHLANKLRQAIEKSHESSAAHLSAPSDLLAPLA